MVQQSCIAQENELRAHPQRDTVYIQGELMIFWNVQESPVYDMG